MPPEAPSFLATLFFAAGAVVPLTVVLVCFVVGLVKR